MFYHTILYRTILYYTILHCSTILYCIMFYHTILYRTILYYTIIILFHTVMYCSLLIILIIGGLNIISFLQKILFRESNGQIIDVSPQPVSGLNLLQKIQNLLNVLKRKPIQGYPNQLVQLVKGEDHVSYNIHHQLHLYHHCPIIPVVIK